MTGEKRLVVALELHELAGGVARVGIRQQFPPGDLTEWQEPLLGARSARNAREPGGEGRFMPLAAWGRCDRMVNGIADAGSSS
jgi:hypothetical protein